MNVFGIAIQTRKQQAAALAAAAAPLPAEEDDGTPEWIQYTRAVNKGASAEMLDGMAKNRKMAARYTRLALYISIPHQALYLGVLVSELHPVTIPEKIEALFGYVIALAVPFLLDQAILGNLRTLITRIASNGSKGRAIGMLVPCLIGSMYLNFASPHAPLAVRIGSAALAVFAAMYQVMLLAKADIRKVGKGEQQLRSEIDEALASVPVQVALVLPAPKRSRKPDKAELDARKRDRYNDKDADGKREWTAKYRARVDAKAAKAATSAVHTPQDLLDAAGSVDDAPVSGIPMTV